MTTSADSVSLGIVASASPVPLPPTTEYIIAGGGNILALHRNEKILRLYSADQNDGQERKWPRDASKGKAWVAVDDDAQIYMQSNRGEAVSVYNHDLEPKCHLPVGPGNLLNVLEGSKVTYLDEHKLKIAGENGVVTLPGTFNKDTSVCAIPSGVAVVDRDPDRLYIHDHEGTLRYKTTLPFTPLSGSAIVNTPTALLVGNRYPPKLAAFDIKGKKLINEWVGSDLGLDPMVFMWAMSFNAASKRLMLVTINADQKFKLHVYSVEG